MTTDDTPSREDGDKTATEPAGETAADTASDIAVDTASDTAVDTASDTAVDTASDTATDTATDGGATAVADSVAPSSHADPNFDAVTGTAAATDTATRSALRQTVHGTVEVAAREFRVAVRRRWTLGVAVLFALFSTALVFLGGSDVGPARVGAVLASFARVGVYVVPLAALAAWVWFVLVHDLVVLGVVASFDLPQWVVGTAVLANPADLFRVLVLRVVPTTAGGIAGVLTAADLTLTTLLGALAAWVVVPVAAAVFALNRRSV